MELQTSINDCLGRARKAFSDARPQDTQHTGLAGIRHGSASVLVSCSSLGNHSYLVVVAASPDSKAAELLRDDVRSRIAAMREFD
jgi:hypothetical protein